MGLEPTTFRPEVGSSPVRGEDPLLRRTERGSARLVLFTAKRQVPSAGREGKSVYREAAGAWCQLPERDSARFVLFTAKRQVFGSVPRAREREARAVYREAAGAWLPLPERGSARFELSTAERQVRVRAQESIHIPASPTRHVFCGQSRQQATTPNHDPIAIPRFGRHRHRHVTVGPVTDTRPPFLIVDPLSPNDAAPVVLCLPALPLPSASPSHRPTSSCAPRTGPHHHSTDTSNAPTDVSNASRLTASLPTLPSRSRIQRTLVQPPQSRRPHALRLACTHAIRPHLTSTPRPPPRTLLESHLRTLTMHPMRTPLPLLVLAPSHRGPAPARKPLGVSISTANLPRQLLITHGNIECRRHPLQPRTQHAVCRACSGPRAAFQSVSQGRLSRSTSRAAKSHAPKSRITLRALYADTLKPGGEFARAAYARACIDMTPDADDPRLVEMPRGACNRNHLALFPVTTLIRCVPLPPMRRVAREVVKPFAPKEDDSGGVYPF
ncbi:hypothetical protein C8R43DRAFT_1186072 [Mycena crocata]|nr:hypothetical protein C8R43DRAFT_1186072 [Mycena crocata]